MFWRISLGCVPSGQLLTTTAIERVSEKLGHGSRCSTLFTSPGSKHLKTKVLDGFRVGGNQRLSLETMDRMRSQNAPNPLKGPIVIEMSRIRKRSLAWTHLTSG
jgi:hypothetical protein